MNCSLAENSTSFAVCPDGHVSAAHCELLVENGIVTVVFTVSDLDRAVKLYRDGFGLDLHVGDHHGDDTWTSGRHAAT